MKLIQLEDFTNFGKGYPLVNPVFLVSAIGRIWDQIKFASGPFILSINLLTSGIAFNDNVDVAWYSLFATRVNLL